MKMTIRLPVALLFFAATGTALVSRAAAQVAHTPLAARVDAVFAQWDRPDAPGCAVAVVEDGEIVYKNGYGMANLEHGVPITPHTVFYTGSLSKQFVAMSIALLAARGVLAFDDDIRRYVSEIPEYDQPITIRHLVHHTSGLRDYLTLTDLAGRDYADAMLEEEVIELLTRQKALNFSPGDQYLYSNSGYFLLAEIVKRASGMTLRAFAEKNIFQLLGMHDSHFHDDRSMIVPNRADGYFQRDDGGWGAWRMRFALVGSGGLYTAVEDLYRWDQNFYRNKLGAGTQALIDTTLMMGTLNNGAEFTYAFGLRHGAYRGLRTIRHGGALGGYRAHLVRFPEQRFSIAITCNLSDVNPGRLADQIADVYLADRLEPPLAESDSQTEGSAATEVGPGTFSPSQLAEFAGTYYSEELDVTYTMSVDGDELFLRIRSRPRGTITMVRRDLGTADPGRISFERDTQGTVTGFTLQAGRVRNLRFVRR